jgi:uncharacterized cupredoxin-like copper-binding protein
LDDLPHTFAADEMSVLMLVGPGEPLRATGAVLPDQRERFLFYCRVPGRRDGGMEDRITVR